MSWTTFKHWLENPATSGLDERQRRQGLFLSAFLLLCLVILAMMMLINLWETSSNSDPRIRVFIIEDVTFGVLLLGLFILNRRGYIKQAAYLLILAALISIAVIPAEFQTYTLVLYFLPIQVASFTVHPRASIPVALISIGLFSALQLSRYELSYGVAVIYLASLLVSAVISWFYSERLEQAVQDARHSEQKYIAMLEGVMLDITARKRAEQVQSATYRISQTAFAADDLGSLYNQIHNVLGELMHAENFFIALYDPETDMLNFPYFVDQFDEPPEPVIARHGLTEYVLRTGMALLATADHCEELVAQGEIADVGTPSVDWMGVPLILNNRTIGVMVVQSYTEGIRFSNEELDILKFVSTQVAMVIERKRAEAELREVNQLTSEVISGVNTGIVVYDREMRHLIWNRFMEQMTGLSEEAVLNKSAADLFPISRGAGLLTFLQRAIAGETISVPDIEYKIPLNGKTGWLSGYCGPHHNSQGEIVGAIAVINEISERKQAEHAMRAALSEKEVLLREIHHRVKNNLQVMSSLISLQADTEQNPAVQDSFREMQARVRSMALIHEELYQAQDFSKVNFAEYIEKLAAGLTQTSRINPNVALRVEVEEVFLGVDIAIPCGLIINELVTNAFKYAFPEHRQGEVVIRLAAAGEGSYRLCVQDNGVGLPPGIDFENTGTLGLQLIAILARQLRGHIQVDLDGGTRIQIEFNENRPIPRPLSG